MTRRVVHQVRRPFVCLLLLLAWSTAAAWPQSEIPPTGSLFERAQFLFFSGRYAEAAAVTRPLLADELVPLAVHELHTAVLHNQIRRALRALPPKTPFTACAECLPLVDELVRVVRAGRSRARVHLETAPADDDTQVLLGRLDLTYVWLQVSTLGRRTGWEEYQEARRVLDAVLERRPTHVRARVARAWIEYIVGTRLPWGLRWVAGGGNRMRGLRMMRDAAAAEADHYTKAEALFGLWEMEVREGNVTEALAPARALLAWFPENDDLAVYVQTHSR